MKYNPFKSEFIYGTVFVVLALMSGLITNAWVMSFLIWALIYVLWKWVELYYFYRWYKSGAEIDDVPLNYGIWQEFCRIVIYNKKRNLKVEKKNKYLLEQFDYTAQALPYATVLMNQGFEITWVNKAALQILGINARENKGQVVDRIITDPDFMELLAGSDKSQEVKIPHPIDDMRKVHIKLIKLSNQSYLLVARDVTEQEVLRKSRKAFVANASHELRTPLTVITGYLEMLSASDDLPEHWEMAIKQSMLQSTRMENIINDMLKLSSIEHERFFEKEHKRIDMPALLNRLFTDVKNSSKAHEHHFTANIDSELFIEGSEEEIISVCLNLMNNAVIHTRVGTTVSVRWYRDCDKAILSITDDGDGIDLKHLPHLTERFYRVDNSKHKNNSSTGLGLAIVKHICDNHHATLSIESKPYKGTTFKISFSSLLQSEEISL